MFGAPVALAARCAGVAPEPDAGTLGSSMVFPATEWGHRDFGEVFPPKKYKLPDGTIHEQPIGWELLYPRTVEMKNIGPTEVREIVNRGIHLPWQSADERAREGLAEFKRARGSGRSRGGSPGGRTGSRDLRRVRKAKARASL